VDIRYIDKNDITDVDEVKKLILKDFFSNYKNNENKIAIVDGFGDKNMAINIINKSKSAFKEKLHV